VAVFKYRVVLTQREGYVESGTVLARSEEEAREKLRKYFGAGHIRLKRVTGLAALFKSFSADIK